MTPPCLSSSMSEKSVFESDSSEDEDLDDRDDDGHDDGSSDDGNGHDGNFGDDDTIRKGSDHGANEAEISHATEENGAVTQQNPDPSQEPHARACMPVAVAPS